MKKHRRVSRQRIKQPNHNKIIFACIVALIFFFSISVNVKFGVCNASPCIDSGSLYSPFSCCNVSVLELVLPLIIWVVIPFLIAYLAYFLVERLLKG